MKCSIIVANYNNGKYLSELIDSVVNQTYSNWELVITDDASTDNSIDVLTPYLTDTRIKLIKHKKNQGVAAAFKSSVDKSTGEIIIMLGADDALLPETVNEVVKLHNKYLNCSMIMGKKNFCDENLNLTGKALGFPKICANDTYLNHFGLVGFDTFKKEVYLKSVGFDIEQKKAVDQALYFAMEEVAPIISVNLIGYLYRTNPNGISQSKNKSYAHEYNYLAIIKAYKRRKMSGFKNISKKKYQEALKNYHYLKFTNHIKSKNDINGSSKNSKLVKAILKNGKPKDTTELINIYELISKNKDICDVTLAKQKLTQSFFIRNNYNFQTIIQLFSSKTKAYKYISKTTIIKTVLKSILNWKK